MSESDHNTTGACACGAITYKAEQVAPVWYCHCQQCRRMTGHFMAASQVALDKIEITGEPKWYYVNQRSRYGFCPDCGSQMFWRNDENNYMSLTAGCMDNTAGLSDRGHIFVSEKGDYYDIPADQMQSEYWEEPAE
ncbi:MAG: GFA family protein [Gammaproteobacteria bacterium]|nr:GFA family protein [Gammaproteobacteria bacterium]